jgi:hypothetical protein
MCYKQNLLSVVALNNLQLLFYCLQSIISIHGLNGVIECQRFGLSKLSKFVTWLLLWRWLILWYLLHVCHLLHSLHHLSLHNQYFLQCWWWRWVGVVVVVVFIIDTVVSVSYLMIVKRFEIEIQDSQLYASRYNDD